MKILGYQFRPELADSGEFVANVQMTASDLERFRAWAATQAVHACTVNGADVDLAVRVADVQRGLFAEMDARDAQEQDEPEPEPEISPALSDAVRKVTLRQQYATMIERAIESADWEPGDAQRALWDLRDSYSHLNSTDPLGIRADVRATHEPS